MYTDFYVDMFSFLWGLFLEVKFIILVTTEVSFKEFVNPFHKTSVQLMTLPEIHGGSALSNPCHRCCHLSF